MPENFPCTTVLGVCTPPLPISLSPRFIRLPPITSREIQSKPTPHDTDPIRQPEACQKPLPAQGTKY